MDPIRILIYTDDPKRVREGGPFGIRELRKHLAAHRPAFADVQVSLVSRNSDAAHHADQRLDDELQKGNYDQVWFFGIHQANKPEFELIFPGGGGPHSELEPDEIAELTLRMSVASQPGASGIGILVAGDHANPPPDIPLPSGPGMLCPEGVDHETFLGLGRALGKHIPRAGELRKWEGPPTHCPEDSFNTQFLPHGGDLQDPSNQADANPQPLILETFDSGGNPSPVGKPHDLFRGRNGKWIQVLPDHDHEGGVVLPRDFPTETWPVGGHFQPRPQVIAYGTDRRTGRRLKILAAYDGDPASVGRILSDSSWHHYFNINLNSLSANPPQSPASDQIGQLFSNMAVWLSPRSKRQAMGVAMIDWLATHPLMLEQAGSGALNTGRLATSLLFQAASSCEIHELLVALCPDSLRERVPKFVFPATTEVDQFPSAELLLGSILGEYFANRINQDVQESHEARLSIIARGFMNAFALNAMAVGSVAYDSFGNLFALSAVSTRDSIAMEVLKTLKTGELISERKTTMNDIKRESWFYTLNLDKNGDEEEFTLILDLNSADCETLGPALKVCKVSGTLKSKVPEVFEVTGTRIFTFTQPLSVINLKVKFRKVKLVISGVIDSDNELLSRFFAHAPEGVASSTLLPPGSVDPDEGDTGTGTGTQTLLGQEEPTSRE